MLRVCSLWNRIEFACATGVISTATNNQLVIIDLKGLVAGPLTASIDVNGESSGAAVEVADVT